MHVCLKLLLLKIKLQFMTIYFCSFAIISLNHDNIVLNKVGLQLMMFFFDN